jgi:hypothetical protein
MDKHLCPVLERASRDDLTPIIELLNDKSRGWSFDASKPLETLRKELHDELLANGGNTFVNAFRGSGVPWAEIVRDVADKLDVTYRKSDATAEVEMQVAVSVLERAIDQMTPEQLDELRDNLERTRRRPRRWRRPSGTRRGRSGVRQPAPSCQAWTSPSGARRAAACPPAAPKATSASASAGRSSVSSVQAPVGPKPPSTTAPPEPQAPEVAPGAARPASLAVTSRSPATASASHPPTRHSGVPNRDPGSRTGTPRASRSRVRRTSRAPENAS